MFEIYILHIYMYASCKNNVIFEELLNPLTHYTLGVLIVLVLINMQFTDVNFSKATQK